MPRVWQTRFTGFWWLEAYCAIHCSLVRLPSMRRMIQRLRQVHFARVTSREPAGSVRRRSRQPTSKAVHPQDIPILAKFASHLAKSSDRLKAEALMQIVGSEVRLRDASDDSIDILASDRFKQSCV